VGNQEGKRPLGRLRHSLGDNLKNISYIGWGSRGGLIWLRIGSGGESL
jgi:hypothetical protein